jgi:ketosteroid isomerase-like protein
MSQANVAIVESAYVALDKGDWDFFYSLFADDVVMHEAPSLPYGGTYYGVEGLKRGIETMFAAWDNMTYKVEQITAGGDLVFVYMHISASSPRTGKTFGFPVAELWRFRDGKVTEFRPFYWDTHRAIEVHG